MRATHQCVATGGRRRAAQDDASGHQRREGAGAAHAAGDKGRLVQRHAQAEKGGDEANHGACALADEGMSWEVGKRRWGTVHASMQVVTPLHGEMVWLFTRPAAL
jgi:hypothetical protein